MAGPWATTTGLLQLVAYDPLLFGSRNNFPKFLGDGKVTTNEHTQPFL